MMETALMDSEMQRELPDSETSTDPGYRMAFAFRRLADERCLTIERRWRFFVAAAGTGGVGSFGDF
jgi:hypothetical protein